MAISVTCVCGKQFKVKDELAGKRGKCAACGQVLSIPTLASSAALEKATPAPLRGCPACREALQPNAVICLHCGHDLRTGKQVPQAMSTAPAAPARPSANVPSSSGLFEFEDAVPSAPSAKVPASSARLWIALIVVGTCLAGVAAAVALLTWGREAGNSAIAPPRSPKADGPVAKKEGPDSKVTPDSTIDQPALKKLLAKVTAITPDDVARYEKFLDAPSLLNAIAYQGTLPYTGDDVRDAINLGLEKLAIAALIRLIQEKKNSTDKADLLICAQSIKALGQFRSHAKEATPLLAELQNYKDNAVGSAAKLALEDINGKPLPPTSAEARDAVLSLVRVVVDAKVLAKARDGDRETVIFALVDRNISIERATEAVVKLKCEPEAVLALLKVISDKRSSRELVEQTACGNAVRALGCFGPEAKDAAPVLTELLNHHDKFVAGEAKDSLKKIQ